MLKVGDYVNIEGISKELFDALVAKAVACGFKSYTTFYHVNNVFINKCNDYLFIDASGLLNGVPDLTAKLKNELTINQWLFTDAPEWVTEVRLFGGKHIYYTDKNFYQSDASHDKVEYCKGSDIDHAKVIATRESVSNEPVVGEEYLITYTTFDETYKGRLLYKGINWVVWLRLDDGKECCHPIDTLTIKPLPQYTDEQLLAYELYKVLRVNPKPLSECIDKEYKSYKKCLNAIKAGWSKTNDNS